MSRTHFEVQHSDGGEYRLLFNDGTAEGPFPSEIAALSSLSGKMYWKVLTEALVENGESELMEELKGMIGHFGYQEAYRFCVGTKDYSKLPDIVHEYMEVGFYYYWSTLQN